MIAGVLVGYLADQEKRRRIDAAAIARVFGRGRSEPGAGGTAHVLVASIARLFKSKRALLVLRGASDRVFLVSAEVPREGRQAAIASTELDEDATAIYLFDAPGDACYGIVAPTASRSPSSPSTRAVSASPSAAGGRPPRFWSATRREAFSRRRSQSTVNGAAAFCCWIPR